MFRRPTSIFSCSDSRRLVGVKNPAGLTGGLKWSCFPQQSISTSIPPSGQKRSTNRKWGKTKTQEADYLYGYHSVLPALERDRRVIRAVHIRQRDPIAPATPEDRAYRARLLALAQEREVRVEHRTREELSKLSGGRPHQGVVLETDVLRDLPRLTHLTGPVPGGNGGHYYGVPTDAPNHLLPLPPPQVHGRSPLWLALDRIQDPQNLGAILRSAYYFGVDGIILGTKESALPSPTASRASAGAMEFIDHFYHTTRMRTFLQKSAEAGWSIIGPMPPSSSGDEQDGKGGWGGGLPTLSLYPYSSPGPSILVFGNEGQGLGQGLTQVLTHRITIPSGNPTRSPWVDSLNVATTAGILIHALTHSSASNSG
ncbi:Alpha/beta knot methyltransferase [Piptocephalis cylindrospora]|uniref:rRNA methyltransferase 1, mitochondrial n=1 Tax=Piptocephalis cylindrospora TaxID=1907219 RepID=A0A4P9Y2Z9_9FUNG|nr:Alpha/beta knot methyltransferase [Piptocephalis cylindrospora]|eukprot:RKP12982.1 Alpha/beta knot methyltransferase [Piptocephalis cylindrospora]